MDYTIMIDHDDKGRASNIAAHPIAAVDIAAGRIAMPLGLQHGLPTALAIAKRPLKASGLRIDQDPADGLFAQLLEALPIRRWTIDIIRILLCRLRRRRGRHRRGGGE